MRTKCASAFLFLWAPEPRGKTYTRTSKRAFETQSAEARQRACVYFFTLSSAHMVDTFCDSLCYDVELWNEP